MAFNTDKKSYTVVCKEKKFFQDRFGKNFFYTNQITHTPPPLKSQMVGPLEPKGLY